ncbi:putative inorganic phosphate transporter [Mycena venus]|uniref:Putative inorganic phosphate transporter n=1 Tax=Mycena venus TaxID=2733690 RepID=A0A8H6WXJ6_9AGAR|nr:putative inorganic phosphate transporter [Mycena venus]
MDREAASDASIALKGADAHYALDERRRAALAEVDNATFSWFHVKVCLSLQTIHFAGVGFFTDAYDIFAINIAATMIGYVYGHQTPGKTAKLNTNQDLGVKVATPVGTLVGQLLFGWLADVLGRKRMYGVELMIIIVGTFAQALSAGNHAVSIVGVLVVWRFLASGDYPLSATISSEFASTRIRGRMMTAVFAAQGWGNFAAVLVSFIVTVAYKNKILADPDVNHLNHVDYMWRIVIGLGCVPGVVALYFRLTIPETPRFTMDIERNIVQASDDINGVLTTGRFTHDPDAVVQRADAPSRLMGRLHRLLWQMAERQNPFGDCLFVIAFYGLGLNSSIILQAIGFGTPLSSGTRGVYDNLHNVTIGNLILSVAGLIPGYWVSFLFIDSWGRKPIQLLGFTMLTLLFIIMGTYPLTASTAGKNAFVFLYCLTNFFQNFGPNTTTFVIPGEIFPTRYRSTGHGISAASGKLGAIVAQVGFSRMVNIGGTNKFVPHILEILAFFMLTGIFSTLLLPETKQQSLEELSNENQEGFVRGPTTQIEVKDGIVVGRRV